MSNLAPPPAANTDTRTTWAWWNAYHTLFAIFLGAYAVYILLILGRMTHGVAEPIPRSLNAILLTALSLAALLSFIAAGNLNRRCRDLEWQAAVREEITKLRVEQTATAEAMWATVAGLTRLNDRLGRDDPTVRLNGRVPRAGGRAYASATVVSGGRDDQAGLAPGQRVVEDDTTTDIDPELRGYLKRVYDEETRRGTDPLN